MTCLRGGNYYPNFIYGETKLCRFVGLAQGHVSRKWQSAYSDEGFLDPASCILSSLNSFAPIILLAGKYPPARLSP